MAEQSDYCYLCFNCGSITPYDAWGVFFYTEDGDRRPPRHNETDPVLECPVCLWNHIDDDSNPGIIDGTRHSCEADREGALDDWGDDWAEVMAEVRDRGDWTGRENCTDYSGYASDALRLEALHAVLEARS